MTSRSASLHRAIELGCTFFDTAWVYGQGRSEKLLGQTIRSHPGAPHRRRDQDPAEEHAVAGDAPTTRSTRRIRPITSANTPRRASRTSASTSIDLQQFHVWNDAWADDDGWKRAIDDLRTAGLVRAVGISINRWEPANVIRALDTGLIDSVQVVYNIFDQAPEDELFPYCEATASPSSRACRSTRAA